jgi:hypothetical protein
MDNYIKQIEELKVPTFSEIMSIAKQNCRTHCATCKPWNGLDHGRKLLTSHEELFKYFCAYGKMHKAKLMSVFNASPNLNEMVKNKFSIIDWGCGQGLATMCFFDYINKQQISNNVEKIILIEPSNVALDRAKLHLNAYIKNENIILPVNKLIDDVEKEDIETETSVTLHFFSNILDIEQIKINRLARLISANANGEHYFICSGPLCQGRERINLLFNYCRESELLVNNEIRELIWLGNRWRGGKSLVFRLADKKNIQNSN